MATEAQIRAAKKNGKNGGRPMGPATIEREKAKAYIAERIGAYMPQIFETLIKKSLDGDIQAIRELFDRGFGRPVQATEITGKDGGAIVVDSTEAKILSQKFNDFIKNSG